MRDDDEGRFKLKRITDSKRLQAKLRAVKTELMRRRHQPIPEQGRWLASVLRGHANYYAVPDNTRRCAPSATRSSSAGYRTLRRRSQRPRMTWKRMRRLADRWLPRRRSSIPGQTQRFDAEPKAGAQCVSSARWDLCGGGSSSNAKTRPYRDPL